MSASCPEPRIIDLSFDEPLPACVAELGPFEIPEGITWGDLATEQKAAIERRNLCLEELRAWEAARAAALRERDDLS